MTNTPIEMEEGVELIESEWLKRMTDFIGPAAMLYMRNKFIQERKQYDKDSNI